MSGCTDCKNTGKPCPILAQVGAGIPSWDIVSQLTEQCKLIEIPNCDDCDERDAADYAESMHEAMSDLD